VIRSAWVWLNVILSTAVIAPIVVLGGLLRVRRTDFYDWATTTWSRWALASANTPVRVEGLENIDPASPQILVGNHQSWFDVWAVASSIPKRYHFVTKKELEGIFIFGSAWKAAGHISIDRSDRASALRSLDQAGQQLRREGGAVVIFAEGTRAPTDALQPFKTGAFRLALHTCVPIVPFGVAGSRRVSPKGSWRVRPGPIIVRFGAPIPTEGLSPDERDALRERVRNEVRRLRDEGRRQLGPGTLESVTKD
jgi:1-acyl-sn-glycerol-3-phosphate acyltransferase